MFRHIINENNIATSGTDKEKYDTIIKLASELVTTSQLSVLKLGVSLHIYSPKIEMFGQMAKELNLPACPIIADVGGKLSCDLKETKELIDEVCFLNA